MPLSKRLFADDAELGKKNDDHRPVDGAMAGTILRTWRGPRRKRILIGIVALYLLFLFFKYLPTDLPPVSKRIDTRFGAPFRNDNPQTPFDPQRPPPRPSKTPTEHYFNGPVKFYYLAATIGYGAAAGQRSNRNVLFAASNLKSASHIVSMACDMSKQNRNNIHFAIMGREQMSLDKIKELNGISDADCAMVWHDARPDYSAWSSDFRMEVSVRAALGHIHKALRPQVVLTDTSLHEDSFFIKSTQDKSNELGMTAIELPPNAAENLPWLSKLDSASLAAASSLEIEIIIHAPSQSSGSLLRLLKSLENADYFGFPHPRLTIELPHDTDEPVMSFLRSFHWPSGSHGADSRLTLRHRVNPTHLTSLEASIRTVESFYPAQVAASHILILTSQAELSSSFYHYLIFSLLEYKYSAMALSNANKLLGISLELPTKQLNGSGLLELPRDDELDNSSPMFLWQAPNSNAALYFGDKWVEFHSFLSNRFTIEPKAVKKETRPKLVSETHPAWMEYLLELIQARGYSVLYPSFAASGGSAVVTVHTDLYQAPEEFRTSTSSSSQATDPPVPENLALLEKVLSVPLDTAVLSQATEATVSTTSSILALMFPGFSSSLDFSGAFALPRLENLRVLSFAGALLSQRESLKLAEAYAKDFRLDAGGCRKEVEHPTASAWNADDLFCLNGQDRLAATAKDAD